PARMPSMADLQAFPAFSRPAGRSSREWVLTPAAEFLKLLDVMKENANVVEEALAEIAATSRELREKDEANTRAIANAHRQGASLRQIASAAGSSPSRVYNVLRRGAPRQTHSESVAQTAALAEDAVVMVAQRWWPLVYKRHAAVVCR